MRTQDLVWRTPMNQVENWQSKREDCVRLEQIFDDITDSNVQKYVKICFIT